ncbi:MAG: Gfo/Idh/MocA family oxidoreductase [Opitutaceae bacterium]|nr:Gfo/Idh/MocA family oxidoreductase [Opitutaceae bacterium]
MGKATQLWNRRRFLGTVGGAAGLLILKDARSARTYQANEKLRVAAVGIGGMGAWNLAHFAGENVEFLEQSMLIKPANHPVMTGENIVALCDVDDRPANRLVRGRRNPAAETFARYPQAKRYSDYRRMLDEMDDQIDAVVVSTPDHLHAPISLAAMRRGKHVYCEKPGAHSVKEGRLMAEVASEKRVATQLGAQIHASENYRRISELLRAGAIGAVQECHIWPRGDGAAPTERPSETPPVPEGLHWDLFLGATSYRPYHPTYSRGCGGNWQRWWDFGCGNLGNMAGHFFNLAFWALDLRHLLSVEAEGPPPHPETTPSRLHLRYQFPARGNRPPVTLTWTHGSQPPPIFAENKFPDWAWGVFRGSEGMLLVNYDRWMLWPEEKFAGFVPPAPSIPPSIGMEISQRAEWMAAYRSLPSARRVAEVGHRMEWVAACKTGSPTACHFGYSGPLMETIHLGAVAYRTGTRLDWDAAHLRITNAPQANALLARTYRPGWGM